MVVQTQWDDAEQTILHTEFEMNWTVEELVELFETIQSMINEVDYPVVMVQDFSHSHYPPQRLIQAARSIHNRIPMNVVQVIIVGASPFLSTLLQLFQRIFPGIPKGVEFVDTMDEARALAANTLKGADRPNSASA